jgi:hypothetical protein
MSEPRKYWLDRSENVTKLYRGLWVTGIALLALDLFLHKHEEFDFAAWFGFYGVFGFLACVVLVLIAKNQRRVLMRSEDYYER